MMRKNALIIKLEHNAGRMMGLALASGVGCYAMVMFHLYIVAIAFGLATLVLGFEAVAMDNIRKDIESWDEIDKELKNEAV